MFTGIVTDLGKIRSVKKAKEQDALFEIYTAYDATAVPQGSSIACSGVCLTVIETGKDDKGYWFRVQASNETLSKTILDSWVEGSVVNLERPLKVGDELGGHIVSGHVDGVGEVIAITPEAESLRYKFKVPAALKRYIASKGSVAIDGVSLTVNEVENDVFGVNIIPHTQKVTTFGAYKVGSKVNLEIDMLARYVARLMERE